ncbi:MAG: TonB-dependent hemoglobin/transferrin/lactoferrin family receptor [Xanthomonadales bacterium]|jgi:hemoglobin/transferrin/lactoferrin receptor protein|nr:TonB-dependent hemoglobin/transferrin/lactoferrin family receptor [Xanthomonadales bacterium]
MRIHTACAALLAAPTLLAAPRPAAVTLDEVIVVASRSEESLREATATVSTVTREQIERTQAQDLRELFRYEPGVSVSGSYGRFGLGDVRIRGLSGNRVQLLVDGAQLPDAFSIGSFSNADRDAVDVSILKRAEVLRGPASALYGSDALGGTVRFVTLDPEDLLGEADWRARLRLGAAGVDDSLNLGATLATRQAGWSFLLHTQAREGHEAENVGRDRSADARRTAANPAEVQQRTVLAKAVRDSADGDRLRLTLDAGRTDTQTEVLSARGESLSFGQRLRVEGLAADDRKTRARVTLDGEHPLGLPWAEAMTWQLGTQRSRTTQDTAEDRVSLPTGRPPAPVRRERRFDFEQRELAFELGAEAQLAVGRLQYGLQASQQRIEQLRDGRAINGLTGAVTSTISPDSFPVRDFPRSRTRELGVYAQLDLRYLEDRLRLVPALRYDRYRLKPTLDPIFAEDNPGIVPVGLAARRVSPKLGLLWQFDDSLALYANAASGFRAPPYNDANLGFTNFAFGYTALPNPNLKPETSRGLDVGLRGEHGPLDWSLTLHATRYRDFIDSLANVGTDPATGLLLFQSINRARVETWGAEAGGRLTLDDLGLPGTALRFAVARTRGIDRSADQWLASVDPLRAVLGLQWRGEQVGAELVATATARQRDVSVVAGSPAPFVAPGSTQLDLLADWQLAAGWRLEAAVYNLADRRIWDPADTAGVPADSGVLDRYTRAGRNARLTLSAEF